jgi:hypothetical protein
MYRLVIAIKTCCTKVCVSAVCDANYQAVVSTTLIVSDLFRVKSLLMAHCCAYKSLLMADCCAYKSLLMAHCCA